MRVAIAVLADAVNVRENMMNILSAGVSFATSTDYPTPLGLDLALMIELEEADVSAANTTQIQAAVVDPSGEVTAEVQGELGWAASDIWPQYVPAPIVLREHMVARPGRYTVQVRVGELDPIDLVVNLREALAEAS